MRVWPYAYHVLNKCSLQPALLTYPPTEKINDEVLQSRIIALKSGAITELKHIFSQLAWSFGVWGLKYLKMKTRSQHKAHDVLDINDPCPSNTPALYSWHLKVLERIPNDVSTNDANHWQANYRECPLPVNNPVLTLTTLGWDDSLCRSPAQHRTAEMDTLFQTLTQHRGMVAQW